MVRGVGRGVADLLRVSVVLVRLLAGLEAVVAQLVRRGRRRLRQALLERVEVISGHRTDGVKLAFYVASHGLSQLVRALYPHQLLDAGRHLFGGELAWAARSCLVARPSGFICRFSSLRSV